MVPFIIIYISFFAIASSYVPDVNTNYHSEGLIKCITDIVRKYIASQKILTYVGNELEDMEILKEIHNLNAVSMISTHFCTKEPIIHQSYFVSSKHHFSFVKSFQKLSKETTWNPNAYFFIAVRSLEATELRNIFDLLLKLHVNNIIVVNATSEAHVYSYNPFDNQGCGKHYENIISYGKCSQMKTINLFPDKYVNGLQNCTFNVAIPNWPPYTIIPPNDTDNTFRLSYGAEPYFLRLVADMLKFKLNIKFEKESETFSTVSSNMEAEGSLGMLQNGEADVVMGGSLLTPSRADAFDCVYNFLPYVDDIRFVLKRADFVKTWKLFYLEFDGLVWILIFLSLTIYSLILIIVLRVQDKCLVFLKLLDNFVLHGCNIRAYTEIKSIFIIWIWFAYLINMFYQSSLISLNINRPVEYQISTEEEIIKHKLKPCFSEVMAKIYKESMQLNNTNISVPECQGKEDQTLKKVNNSKEYYSLMLLKIFEYNKQYFYDQNGNLKIYLLKQPFFKVIYSMYFYKGFPLMHKIHENALRVREMGLVAKALSDISYMHGIKHNIDGNMRHYYVVVPWYLFIFGCTVATLTFLIEIFSVRSEYHN